MTNSERCAVDCAGHMGKFADCVTEAIWQLSLDSSYSESATGSVEAYGWYALMTFDEAEAVTLSDGSSVSVPKGTYIISTNDQGFVYLSEYGDDTARAEADFKAEDDAYGEWLDVNEPEAS